MDKMFCLAGKELCSFCWGAQDPSTVLCSILKEMCFETGLYKTHSDRMSSRVLSIHSALSTTWNKFPGGKRGNCKTREIIFNVIWRKQLLLKLEKHNYLRIEFQILQPTPAPKEISERLYTKPSQGWMGYCKDSSIQWKMRTAFKMWSASIGLNHLLMVLYWAGPQQCWVKVAPQSVPSAPYPLLHPQGHRKTCQWQLGSSHCIPDPAPREAGVCEKGAHSSLLQPQQSEDSQENWTSLIPE